VDDALLERLDALATWVSEIDTRVRTTEVATGDEKTARELRRAIEALAKHDPKLEKRLTNRVDVLSDRLTTLASTVSTTAAALAGKEGEIANLRRELEKGSERIEALMHQLGKRADAAEIEKLHRAIATISSARPTPVSDKRVDELGGKVDWLAERLDTLAKTVSTTAAGLAGREGELAILRQRLEEGSTQVDRALAEFQHRHGESELADQLDSLATAVAATTSGLAARESEIAAVRGRIDEAYARVGAVVTDIRESIGALSAQISAHAKFPEAAEQALEARASEIDGRVDALGERLESLAVSVESALSGLASREVELAALNRHVDEASARVDTIVGELRHALSELPEPGSVDPAVEARLEELAGTVAAVTHQLLDVESATSERVQDAASRTVELERMLAEVGDRLATVERERDAVAAELARAGEAWAAEREWVRVRLEELAAAHANAPSASEEIAPLLTGLGARLDALEGDREAMAAEIVRVSDVLDVERASLQAQLEALGATLADTASAAPSEGSEQLLAELAERLDGVERDGAAVASEIARTAAYWATELESIEERLGQVTSATVEAPSRADAETEQLLAQLAARLDAMERDRTTVAAEIARVSEAWASDRSTLEGRLQEVATHVARVEATAARPASAAPAPPANEVSQLRVQVDGLRMRLAASEQELSALASSREVSGRMDELSRRIDGVERMTPSVVSPPGAPLPGDGRFRLELRALELRMEHAEAASREHREAVLVQLERLASRIEWRLQRLEAEHADALPEAVGGGAQVVPIRGKADV
jgi:chromosome segregation ATPase